MIIQEGTIVYDSGQAEYEVSEFIGNGSFGYVYKIKAIEGGETFALKTIQTPFVDPTTLHAFLNEGNLATKIDHKNVVKQYYFHDGDTYSNLPPYLIMEYASGGTLKDVISSKAEEQKFFTVEEMRYYFVQLIDGMKAINEKLIHRDVKPENILVSDNILKISDFGLSKVVTESTRTTTFKGIGCLPYLAPEGWRSEKNTIQMDIYSMGIVFFEIAALEHPLTVQGRDVQSWESAHLHQPPELVDSINSSISPILSQLIMKMIDSPPPNATKIGRR